MRAARIVTAVVSALVLLVTGYGWTAYRELGARLVTSDVLTRDRPSDGVTDILLVGLDSRTDAAGNPLPRELLDTLAAGPDQGTLNTDTLILVRIPDDAGLLTTAVSIPRDSFVPVPGFGTQKINSAYVRSADATRARLVARGLREHGRAAGVRAAAARPCQRGPATSTAWCASRRSWRASPTRSGRTGTLADPRSCPI